MTPLKNEINHIIWAQFKNIIKYFFISSDPSFLFLMCGDGYSFCENDFTDGCKSKDFTLSENVFYLKNRHNADNNGGIIFSEYSFSFDIGCEEYND